MGPLVNNSRYHSVGLHGFSREHQSNCTWVLPTTTAEIYVMGSLTPLTFSTGLQLVSMFLTKSGHRYAAGQCRYLWPVDLLNCFLFRLSRSQFFLYIAWGPASGWLDSCFEVSISLRAMKTAKNGKFQSILTIANGGRWLGGDSGAVVI